MDALELFTLRYDVIHGEFVDELFSGLTDEQLRQQPRGVNPVVWLVWHAARVQDAAVSRLVADRAQVLDEGGWNPRLRLDRRDVGTGMTGADVEALSRAIDVAALRGYHRAVADRTQAIATALPAAAWSEVVPPEQVRRVVAGDGLLVEAGKWVEDFWAAGRTRGWYLLQVGLLHPYGHWFEAMVTRGLLAARTR
jgi:hypothetical protein